MILSDTTITSSETALYDMLKLHPDQGDMYTLVELSLALGLQQQAQAWLDTLDTYHDRQHDIWQELTDLHSILGQDWMSADSSQSILLSQLMDRLEPGAAMSRAVAHAYGLSNALPELHLPEPGLKSLPASRMNAFGSSPAALLTANPNPTNGQTWIVLDIDLDTEALLRLHDPLGRHVLDVPLKPDQKIVEMDLTKLANGLYACELICDGLKLEAIKITVSH